MSVVICDMCDSELPEDSSGVVWFGYAPFHGDCLADKLKALGLFALRRRMTPTDDEPVTAPTDDERSRGADAGLPKRRYAYADEDFGTDRGPQGGAPRGSDRGRGEDRR